MKQFLFVLTFLFSIVFFAACTLVDEKSGTDPIEKEEMEMVNQGDVLVEHYSLTIPEDLELTQETSGWNEHFFKKDGELLFILSEYKKEEISYTPDKIITLVPQVVEPAYKIEQDQIQGHNLIKVWYLAFEDVGQAMTSLPNDLSNMGTVYSYLVETKNSYLLFHFIGTDPEEGLNDQWFEEVILAGLEILDFESEGFDDYFDSGVIYLKVAPQELPSNAYEPCSDGPENSAQAFKFKAGNEEVILAMTCSFEQKIPSVFDFEARYVARVVDEKPEGFPSAVDHLYLVGRQQSPPWYWVVEIEASTGIGW